MDSRHATRALAVAAALAFAGPGAVSAHGPGGPGGMMFGPGTMGPGMMGHGMMMGPGMMGPGMMGHGMMMPHGMMMGPGMMGPGMMGPGGMMFGPGMMGPGGAALSPDDVRAGMERWLAWRGNPRLKLGPVKAEGEDAVVADIVTKAEGALVERLKIDRHTGQMARVP